MQIVRPVVQGVGGVPGTVRDLARLQEIASVLVKHGLGVALAGLGLPGLPTTPGTVLRTTPDRVVLAFQDLGPTFVKLGQILSTRRDILPDDYCAAFEQLQDDVSPVPFADLEAVLVDQLGEAWRSRIDRFDDAPLATASIAQVHRATLVDGTEVVFKIQRPGIAAKIRSDLNILEFLARRILVEFPETRSFDPHGVLAEFEASITAELDFMKEVESMARFRANFEGSDEVVIPAVYEDLTTARVLCMEFLDGVKIRNARAAGCDMDVVGERYMRAAYDMLFDHGFFHGDLHPGNVLVLPGNRIGILDFGMVGTLTTEMKNQVISIIFALQRGDYRTIARLFYEIAIKDERVDYRAVERDTVEVMEKHWSHASIKDMQMGPYIMDLVGKAAKHGARVPSSYTMFFKAIMTSEGLAKALIEEVDPITAAQPYFQRMLTDRLSPDRLQHELFYNLLTLSTLGSRLPVSLAQFLDDVDAQRLLIRTSNADLDRELSTRDRLQKRGILAGFAVTLILCGTLTLLTDRLSPWGVPIPALVLWATAVPFLAATAWLMLRGQTR